jgi:hypothetical protein
MKTFLEFINSSINEGDSKFNSVYEMQNFIYGKSSPNSYNEAIAFYSKLSIPSELKPYTPEKGKLDTLLLRGNGKLFMVELDYPRKLMRVFEIEDELDKGTLYKTYSFESLVGSSVTESINNDFSGVERINEIVSNKLEKIDGKYTLYQFLSEGDISGRMDKGVKSMQSDWDRFYKGTDTTKLIYKNLGGSHYKLFNATSKYFLTDRDNEYLGYIELNNISSGKVQIKSSSSNLSGGFYKIMFPLLLSLPNIEEIYSDDYISENAFKAYKRLNDGGMDIRIYSPIDNKYLALSIDNYKLHKSNVISVLEKENHKGGSADRIAKYADRRSKRIQENLLLGIPKYHGVNDRSMDQDTFCNTFWDYSEYYDKLSH